MSYKITDGLKISVKMCSTILKEIKMKFLQKYSKTFGGNTLLSLNGDRYYWILLTNEFVQAIPERKVLPNLMRIG